LRTARFLGTRRAACEREEGPALRKPENVGLPFLWKDAASTGRRDDGCEQLRKERERNKEYLLNHRSKRLASRVPGRIPTQLLKKGENRKSLQGRTMLVLTCKKDAGSQGERESASRRHQKRMSLPQPDACGQGGAGPAAPAEEGLITSNSASWRGLNRPILLQHLEKSL